MAAAEDTGGPAPTTQRDSHGPPGGRVLSRSRTIAGDDRLAARASKGDRNAFAELYRRHHQRLYRYCLSLVGDPDDAADALQSTMAKALAALERAEPVKGVRPWLFRIAHNAAIDVIRGRRARMPLDEIAEIEASELTAPSAASEAQSRADLAEVVSDIRLLPERQSSALVMRELSELSYAEIAGALDTSQLAARQLVHQARSRLHDERDGKTMECETVRHGLGDTNGRRPRDRRMRAHLAACRNCQSFATSIRRRRSALAVIAPPLAPLAASDILARLLGSGNSSGAAVAAGGVAAGATKLAGASGAAKLAGAAAAGTALVAVGGAVVAGGALLGPGDPDSRATTQSPARASLVPGLSALRPMREPANPRSDEGSPSASGGSEAEGSRSPSGPSGDGLPSAELAQSDPVELDAARDGLEGASAVGSVVPRTVAAVGSVGTPSGGGGGLEVPGVDIPGGSGGPDVEIPDVDLPRDGAGFEVPDVGVPDVEVPDVEIPDVDGEIAGGSVDVPDEASGAGVEVPDVEIPDAGSVELDVPEPSVEVSVEAEEPGS